MRRFGIALCCLSLFLPAGCATRSLGPIDSPNYINVLASSINIAPLEILYNARSNWFVKYLEVPGYSRGVYYDADVGIVPKGILTITSSKVMFLVWSEERNMYGSLFALPISDITSVNSHDDGLTIGFTTKDRKFYLLQVLTPGLKQSAEHKNIEDILKGRAHYQ